MNNPFFLFHTKNGDFMKILITGSSSGIGFDTGVRLLKKGHFVYFTVHLDSQIETLIEKLKELNLLKNASVFKLDITDIEDRKLIYQLDVDCLLCNAAVGYGGSVLDIPISHLEENFKVNVFSNIELIQMYCGHLFLEKKQGKIVVMSSIAGIIPIPFLGSYCVTKASLITLTTCLKKELKLITNDIKVKLIEPGIFNTGFNDVMIENKKESIYFDSLEPTLTNTMKGLFSFFGYQHTNCITNKIIKAIESDSNKLVYSAPLSQKIVAKLYSLFR